MKKMRLEQLKQGLMAEIDEVYDMYDAENRQEMKNRMKECTTVDDVVQVAMAFFEGMEPAEVMEMLLKLVVE